ncbi:MAG: aldo/keto reductase [Chloroflexota bacterium]
MEYRTLGRTGLQVSVMGLGGGGPSQLGKRTDKTKSESIRLVQQAFDLGVNFIDTAEGYGTEDIVGEAISTMPRDQVIISTKKSTKDDMTPADVRQSLEASLRHLGTDYIDIYHLHGVRLHQYDRAYREIVPTLLALRDEGKIRFLGITELFNPDPAHHMLQQALKHDVWDVIMVGFNILNQSARETVFSKTIAQNVGVLVMFAVRLALSRPERLREVVAEMITSGQLDPADINAAAPLGFMLDDPDIVSLTDAAYRFCRDEPGTHVILSGTGNPDHLQQNVEALNRPPLSPKMIKTLKHIFRNVDAVSGQ